MRCAIAYPNTSHALRTFAIAHVMAHAALLVTSPMIVSLALTDTLPYTRAARAIGVSNFNASSLASFMPRVSVKPSINQCGYSIAGHGDDLWGRDDATKQATEALNITYSACECIGSRTLDLKTH